MTPGLALWTSGSRACQFPRIRPPDSVDSVRKGFQENSGDERQWEAERREDNASPWTLAQSHGASVRGAGLTSELS